MMTGRMLNNFRKSASMFLLLLAAVPASVMAASENWLLTIEGRQHYTHGDAVLGGGVSIPWQVELEFKLKDGVFVGGSGQARWLDDIDDLSVPKGWFSCSLQQGTYLDSNGQLRPTPRMRFPAFPLAGAVHNGELTLRAGYDRPGNYLAVTYACETTRPFADNWFIFAERAKQEQGKRQDATTREQGDRRSVSVSEVQSLPPAGLLKLPLRDGWFFVTESSFDGSEVRYSLRRR